MNKEILHGPKTQGGLNLPKVSEFFMSLEFSWIRRNAITKVNDHWADQIDLFFNLTQDCRSELFLWGSERFNEIKKSGIPCIAGWFKAYKEVKHCFPRYHSQVVHPTCLF